MRDRVADTLRPGQRGSLSHRRERSTREGHEGRVANGWERTLGPQAKHLAQADDLLGFHAVLEGAATLVPMIIASGHPLGPYRLRALRLCAARCSMHWSACGHELALLVFVRSVGARRPGPVALVRDGVASGALTPPVPGGSSRRACLRRSAMTTTMSHDVSAYAFAETQVAAVRDDPSSRVALMARLFHGPTGRAPRHVPFRLAALSFVRWQEQRGVLNPIDASPPGSVWWRAMNERLLRDGCEAIGLLSGLAGEPSSHAVRLWLEFSAMPTGRNWYRAHNASIVGGYLEHRNLAEAENAPERFFMNVALLRVLYAHVLVGAPSLALGRLAPLGRVLGDPRFGMAGVFLSLHRVVPNRYPLSFEVERYIAAEHRLARMLDYAVIVPRLQRVYEWSAHDLNEPRLLELVRDGNPIYVWLFEQRHVWRSPNLPIAARVLERVTRASVRSPSPTSGHPRA